MTWVPFRCPNCQHVLGTLKTPLTRRQHQVLTAVREFEASHGYMPTLAELAAVLGLRSIATVSEHMSHLERKGYVVRSGMRYRRNLKIVGCEQNGRE